MCVSTNIGLQAFRQAPLRYDVSKPIFSHSDMTEFNKEEENREGNITVLLKSEFFFVFSFMKTKYKSKVGGV